MTSKFSLLLGGALFAITTPAMAQNAGEENPGDEIVVTGEYIVRDQIDTATGLGLSVQETPQSVTIITAQRILDQNLVTAADVLKNTAGVSVNEVDDIRNNFYSRGFAISNFQYDSVPLAWTLSGGAGETSTDASIYERVEIVRGATGLLTGVGDPSASVNFVRKHADARELTGYVNASYGSWNTWRASADISAPITSDGRIRARAVGRYVRGENFIDFYKSRRIVAYGTIDADVTDTTLLRAGISHQKGDNDQVTWGALPSFYNDGSFITWPRSRSTTSDWTYWDTTNQNIFASLRQDLGDGWSVTANYNRMRNSQKTEILYLYGTIDRATGTAEFSNPYSDVGNSVQNSYDVQVKGKVDLFGRDHEIVVGVISSLQKRYTDVHAASFPADYPPNVPFDPVVVFPRPNFAATPFRSVEERVKQTGFYGALRLNLSDSLKVIGGGRLSSWSLKGFGYAGPQNYGDKRVFIPYAGLLFDVTSNHRIYASYTKIFQPQSALDRNFRQLDPLEGNAYEVGLKSNFLDNRLQTSIALFRVEQDNLAEADGAPIIPFPGATPQQTYRAAKGTKSEGFEIEVNGSPMENWNVNLSYTQFKAENAAGDPVATDQSRRLAKLFTTYTLPDVLGGLTFGGGANYRSKSYADGFNPVLETAPGVPAPFRFQQKGYVLVSLMTRLAVTEQFAVQANVENLLDKTYYSQVNFLEQYRYGQPRSFTVSANYKF